MTVVIKKKADKPKQVSLFNDEAEIIPTTQIQADCNKCEMRQYANRVVWGSGSIKDIVLIGEAPGFEEDEKGVPFVGASGKLLRKALGNLDPYITNVVKCHPPNNRTPDKTEIRTCSKFYILDEIKDAKIVILLGNSAKYLKLLYPESFKGKFVMEKPHPAHSIYKHYQKDWIMDFQVELRYLILLTFDTETAYVMNYQLSEADGSL